MMTIIRHQNLLTLITICQIDDATTENNFSHENNDICMLESNVHENDMHENISSMSAQSMLNLGRSKKGFKLLT